MDGDVDWPCDPVGSVPGLSPEDWVVWLSRDAPRLGGV